MCLIEKYVQVIKRITEAFPKEVIHCYLFGFVAKRCITDSSDIDLCIILEQRNEKLEEDIIKSSKVISGERDLKSLNESLKYNTSYNEDYCYKAHQVLEKLFLDSDVKKVVDFTNMVYSKVEPLVREDNGVIDIFDKIKR